MSWSRDNAIDQRAVWRTEWLASTIGTWGELLILCDPGSGQLCDISGLESSSSVFYKRHQIFYVYLSLCVG